jgi:hypothetical protein
MKVFWAITCLLAIAAIILAFQPPREGRVASGARASEAAQLEEMLDAAATPTPAPDPKQELVADLLTARATEVAAVVKPIDAAPAPVSPDATGPTEPTPAPARTIPSAEVVPGTITRQADGSILLDGRWVVRGEGTAERPYRINWDLLTSAGDTYQPRTGSLKLPGRIAFLDGAHVKIEGYLAFPLVASESKEALVMLNQWDGCCIGVPPTPYDAIEVKLDKAVPVGRRHAMVFGSVEGVLRVEPYLVEQWLVGMYLLDGGTLKIEL